MEKAKQLEIVNTAMHVIQEAIHPSLPLKNAIGILRQMDELAVFLQKELKEQETPTDGGLLS